MTIANALNANQQGVQYQSSSGIWSGIDGSTATYVLTSNGTGMAPSFQAVSSSGSITTIDGDSGSMTPTAGAVTISGGTSGLTTSASSSTMDITGVLKLAHGGTNANLTASDGGIFYSTASAGAILAGTSTASQVLLSGASATPAWSTATYPATAGSSGNVLTSDGTNWHSSAPATSGTVTSVSVVSTNGFAGTVANATTTPAITMETTQTGLLSGNGTAITGTAITEYNVITAGASNAPNSVAPSATSGVPLISQGSASQPVFGTAVVAGGGTGDTSFTTYMPICGGTSTTGALQSVSESGASAGYVLTYVSSSALPTWQAAGGGSVTIAGDSGSISGSSLTIYADQAAANCGYTVKFVNSGTTSTLNVSDGYVNTMVGADAGQGIGSPGTAVGNTSFGAGCLAANSYTGTYNCVMGGGAAPTILSGSYNLILGTSAGANYTGSESSNILLNHIGVVSESNTIRIGQQGSGSQQVNRCFIAGIYGVSPSSPQMAIINSSGQLGSQAIPSGGGITTIDGDTGSITGSTVTIKANNASNSCGSSVLFSNSGTTSTLQVTDGNNNTFVGLDAGNLSGGSGGSNCGFGLNAITSLTTGTLNSALGVSCMYSITNGARNSGIGVSALDNTASATDCTAIGYHAGHGYNASETSNICIGSVVVGVTGENNTLRIGVGTGTSQGQINAAYISGIYGISIGTSTAVLINSSNQLGTAVSSERFKDNIEDLAEGSEFIHQLRPVKFTLKAHPEYGQQAGLIAEEVYELVPGLVTLDKEGRPESVAYHELSVLILNELQKLKLEVEKLQYKK